MIIKLISLAQTITVGTAESLPPLEIDARELDVERLDEKDDSKDDDNASKLPPIYVSLIGCFICTGSYPDKAGFLIGESVTFHLYGEVC